MYYKSHELQWETKIINCDHDHYSLVTGLNTFLYNKRLSRNKFIYYNAHVDLSLSHSLCLSLSTSGITVGAEWGV